MDYFEVEGQVDTLKGSVSPSGNKNEALPALLSCLLTDQEITLRRIPKIADVMTLCEILKDLGVRIEWLNSDTITLQADNLKFKEPDPQLCSRIRASILLMGPMLARFQKLKLPLPGGDVIGARRIDSHFEALTALGAQLELSDAIYGQCTKPKASHIYLDEPSVSGTENALFLAVLSEGKTTIYNAACEPHVKGLCLLLNKMGAKISGIASNKLEIQGVSSLKGADYTIGPDFMEIGSFLCLSAITGGNIVIKDTAPEDLRFILKTFNRLGIQTNIEGQSLSILKHENHLNMQTDISGRVATIYSCPWPAFPTDLMSVTIVAATQACGTMIFHEKMFEGRMFFTDKLMAMGANIVLCDPHRIVVTGPSSLKATHMSSPDVRAGMALLMTALIAQGTSKIDNIYQIDRGYYQIEEKLQRLGAKIKRVKS